MPYLRGNFCNTILAVKEVIQYYRFFSAFIEKNETDGRRGEKSGSRSRDVGHGPRGSVLRARARTTTTRSYLLLFRIAFTKLDSIPFIAVPL